MYGILGNFELMENECNNSACW